MANYKEEFPLYDDILPTLEGFEDGSWHNDACPSLIKTIGEEEYIQVFCDYKDQNNSDFADLDPVNYKRFGISQINREGDSTFLFETNNWDEVIQFFKAA